MCPLLFSNFHLHQSAGKLDLSIGLIYLFQ
nr:MAG TPA: hypothetical protein [Caudoviricetes sp.]